MGSCYYFNGNQQWIQFDSVLGDFYNNDWSIACWLKPTDSTRGVIISEFNGSGASNVSIELSADGPLKEPYNVYFQGGLTYEHSKFGVIKALDALNIL